jgi:hypothetical protein
MTLMFYSTEYQPINTILITNSKYIIRNKTFQVLCLADASPRAHFFIYQGEMKVGNFTYGNVTITPGNGTTENISCVSKNKYGEGKRAYLSIPIYGKYIQIKQVTVCLSLQCC